MQKDGMGDGGRPAITDSKSILRPWAEFSGMRECSGANGNAQFISYLESQCQCPANFSSDGPKITWSAMILTATARPRIHGRRPRLCFSLHETKKEHVPIPRMPQRVNCSPAFWITSSEAEYFLYPLYKRGWGIKFQPRSLTVSPVNVSHCFYSHSHQNPNCCRIDMLRTL